MEIQTILILFVAGILVGFINTLAGGGSVISLSVLMLLGLPANVANGTNRIAIIGQSFTGVASFRRQKVLDLRKGLLLSLTGVAGSLVGAWIAVDINEAVFEKALAVIMLVMLVFIFYKPGKYLYGREDLQKKPISFFQMVLFFFIGFYGGFIHMGIGYFLLAALVYSTGYDLVKANAVKVLMALAFTSLSFFIFLANGQVRWNYGLILTAGAITGTLIAVRMAVKQGVAFVRWVIVVVILIMSADLFGVLRIRDLLAGFL